LHWASHFCFGYAVIAKLYFFTAAFRGVVLAAVLYLLGILVNRA